MTIRGRIVSIFTFCREGGAWFMRGTVTITDMRDGTKYVYAATSAFNQRKGK
jgi:hypothetical protein